MLRLVHNQTIAGGILVDDIDDGLPNKEVHRLGSKADPKAYERDGYANKSKQKCYIPRSQTNAGFPTIPGYITINQSQRVTLSAGSGKIQKLQTAGLITVSTLSASQIATPVVSAATITGSNFVITGTTFTSVSPDVTTVTFVQGTGATVPSPAVWTTSLITGAGGTVSGTSISIPTAAFTGQVPVTGNAVIVNANEQNSNTFASADTPHLSAASTTPPNFIITGTNLNDLSGATGVVFAAGSSVVPVPATWTQAAIVAALGSVTATHITIPSVAFTTAPTAGNTVTVTANTLSSNVLTTT